MNPKCEYCGKFMSYERCKVVQPETDIWKMEPDDPILVCPDCHLKEINDANVKT